MTSDLVSQVRSFWYNNVPGTFSVGGFEVSRDKIYTHGGPATDIACPICQEVEWKSRIAQRDLFEEHPGCMYGGTHQREPWAQPPLWEQIQMRCAWQADEMWTHYQQDFSFSIGCDSQLNAPKCLYLFPTSDPLPPILDYARFVMARNCDFVALVRKRQMAIAGQVEVHGKDYSGQFDYALVRHTPGAIDYVRPDMPVVLVTYDPVAGQPAVDYLQPEYLLTPCPSEQQRYLKLPAKTEVVLWPQAASSFFTRSNLGEKKYDLITTGTLDGATHDSRTSQYWPRAVLNNQLVSLVDRYKIEFFNGWGSWPPYHPGPSRTPDWDGKINTAVSYHYLNMYSDVLGSARYVAFAPISGVQDAEDTQLILAKHYECLGSGAIPIFPDSPDRKYIGIEPYVHYIPFSEIDGNNKAVKHYLDNYADYRYIAVNAVAWYKENVDRMIFDEYEDFIRRVTGYKYPKRLIE